MAKFLNTTGVSYHLEELMKNTKERLILISPYLQFNDRIKEHIVNLNVQKRDIRIIFRENKLQLEENNWLESQLGVRTSLNKNLHAKCYINESEAIITSMNLYEFSQLNNNEMGIHITKLDDGKLYAETLEEAQRLLNISEEIRISVKKVTATTPAKSETKKTFDQSSYSKPKSNTSGFCIRTGVPIPFDIQKPLSYDSYKAWNNYGDENHPENFCHFTGERSNGETSVKNPILKKNWKRAKEQYDL
ncbi:MAG TPA: phospholipase D family protein [Aquella sp.]|nr:phospholipase D family protein [Aquella sp.]